MHSRLKIKVKLTANLLNALKNDTSITRMTDARLLEEDKVLLVPYEKKHSIGNIAGVAEMEPLKNSKLCYG